MEWQLRLSSLWQVTIAKSFSDIAWHGSLVLPRNKLQDKALLFCPTPANKRHRWEWECKSWDFFLHWMVGSCRWRRTTSVRKVKLLSLLHADSLCRSSCSSVSAGLRSPLLWYTERYTGLHSVKVTHLEALPWYHGLVFKPESTKACPECWLWVTLLQREMVVLGLEGPSWTVLWNSTKCWSNRLTWEK